MDRGMAQVPPPARAQVLDRNQDRGKAPQVSGQDHDQQQSQAQLPNHEQNQLQVRAQVLGQDQHGQEQAQAQVLGQDQDRGKAPLLQDADEDEDEDEDFDQDRALQLQSQDRDQIPNQDQDAVPKKNKGRQKINIAKMQNGSNLQVTFSKRRSGLFKKASELATLCGVELVIIVFSPGKKAFSFGHPSVDDILDRFLAQAPPPPDTSNNIILVQRDYNFRHLNNQLANMQAMFEAERKKKLALDHARAVSQSHRPWEAPIDELSHDALVALKGAMLNLQANLAKHIEMQTQQKQINSLAFHPGTSSFRCGGGGGGTGGGGAASSSFGRDGINVLPSFSPDPNFFGEGGGNFSQYVDGSTSYRGGGGGVDPAFSTGLNYFGGGVGGALPSSTGPMNLQSSIDSSSLGGGGGALPFSTWSSSVGGGSTSFSGALPLLPGESSLTPPGTSSLGRVGALPYPPAPSSFGRGLGGAGGLHIGPSLSGLGRGLPPGSASRRGRGSNRGTGRGSQ